MDFRNAPVPESLVEQQMVVFQMLTMYSTQHLIFFYHKWLR